MACSAFSRSAGNILLCSGSLWLTGRSVVWADGVVDEKLLVKLTVARRDTLTAIYCLSFCGYI